MKKKVIVIFSGGMDSTILLFWALEKFQDVLAVTFDYGQKNIIEIKQAKQICKTAGIKQKILKIPLNKITESDLLKGKKSSPFFKKYLPPYFVPARNAVFLTLAVSFGIVAGITDYAIAVSEVDFSGYPDCRVEFIRSMEDALSRALDKKIKIHTPFIKMSKKREILLAKKMGIMDRLGYSYSCYRGKKIPCGVCDSCRLRANAFKEAGLKDPYTEKLKGGVGVP